MGTYWSQTFPPTSNFNVDNMTDLSGKVVIVTGGNSGVGKEIIRALLLHNAKVYMASRNVQKARIAIEELSAETGREALFLQLDLSSLREVKQAAEEFVSKERELHALVNNGAVMYLTRVPRSMDVSEDGFDVTWATNVLGPFYLSKLLLPTMMATAEHPVTRAAHITFTSSVVQTTGIKWDTLKDTPERRKLGPDQRYMQSKFANVVLAQEFARRYGDKGIISVSDLFLRPPAMGALTTLWGISGENQGLNGKHLIPIARIGTPSEEPQDLELGSKLWHLLEESVSV
ncbi:NAD-binding protein [Lentinula aff. lateritia]|uniref:NAD-binding protein n=1 Tax=Lentinula aff. lateritia TaxID=2804960 RepID=A0ACC1THJ5_9AGAR|nr:NAD-binding protein [Lentinula aff. lateritia]